MSAYIDEFYHIAISRAGESVSPAECLRGLPICNITINEEPCRKHVEQELGLKDTFEQIPLATENVKAYNEGQ